MDVEYAIIAMGVLYFIGHLLTHFFDKAKVPDVLILIAFGMIIGPLLDIIKPDQLGAVGTVFTSVALIIILFEGGLNLELKSILRYMNQSIRITLSFFFITAAIITCIMHFLFGYTFLAGLITGFICGGTSSAVVIPMVNALKVGKEATTMLVLESALTDVLCIVLTIGVLHSADSGIIKIGHIVGNLISSLVLASVTGFASGLIWLKLIDKIRQFQNTQFATFAIMFIVYGIAESLNFNGAIASLAFGIVLGNNYTIGRSLRRYAGNYFSVGVVTEAEKALYREIVFLLKIFFFVYLGISIPIERVYIVMIAVTIVMAVYVARPLATKLIVRQRATPRDLSIIGVMVPKGLAAAVLAGLPMQYGMAEGSDIQAITYYVVLISIITTSLFIPIIEKTPLGKVALAFFAHDKEIGKDEKNSEKEDEPKI